MKNLYILQDIDEAELSNLNNENADFIAFDYVSHKKLESSKISHKLLDDYIDDNERKEVFQFCSNWLKKYEKYDQSNVRFHNIDLVSVIDRNELHEFLMDIIPKIKVVTKILEKKLYDNVFVSSNIYELFSECKFKGNLKILNRIEKNLLTFEKIEIPIKFGIIETKLTISRRGYKILKRNIEKIILELFSLRRNYKEKKKIILVEFNPEIYSDLLQEIYEKGFQPILVNFRKTSIYSKKAINYLKKSKSLIITPEQFLGKTELKKIKEAKVMLEKKINDHLENKKYFLDLSYEGIDCNLVLQKKICSILVQRLDEYLDEISVAETIKNMKKIMGILVLNHSGETEKIFSMIHNKIPIFLLQHAFSNYTKSISFFDILDDYHLIKSKIAVWGEVVKDYLIDIKKIPENKIIVSGSPKYDSYFDYIKKNNNNKIILVTLRPIINHMEGPRIGLYKKYEKVLQELAQISKTNKNLEIIFKLHPQQNVNNQIIRDMIKTNEQIKILQYNPIKELLSNCDLHINIATDNFDASSVILEAMILRKPTLNIQLQKNEIEFEFIKDNAIKSINFDSDIKHIVMDLLNGKETDVLMKNSQIHLNRYMSNNRHASKTLIEAIENLSS